jgi:hypothetical protein
MPQVDLAVTHSQLALRRETHRERSAGGTEVPENGARQRLAGGRSKGEGGARGGGRPGPALQRHRRPDAVFVAFHAAPAILATISFPPYPPAPQPSPDTNVAAITPQPFHDAHPPCEAPPRPGCRL